MDKKDRDLLKNANKLRIENFGIDIRKAVAAKQVMRQALANLDSRETNDMYTAEYRDSEKARAKQAFHDKMVELYNKDVEPSITALGASLEEQHSDFDVEGPRWLGTIKTIEMGGKDTPANTMRQLVAPWAHDQAALEALQLIIKRAGILYDGGLDKMRYDIPATIGKIQAQAKDTFLSEGSINRFASDFGKLAAFEGVKFETNPDPAGANEVMRAASGLPPEGPKGPEGK